MARIWTNPRDWAYKDVLTATLANQQLRDNLMYLKMKPRNYAALQGVANDVVSATTTLAAVNDSKWVATITTSEVNEEVFVYFHCVVTLATAAQLLIADVLIDNTTFLSSGTGTAFSNGVMSFWIPTTNAQQVQFRQRYVVPTIGTHTFKLRTRISVTTNNVSYVTATSLAQFGVQVE